MDSGWSIGMDGKAEEGVSLRRAPLWLAVAVPGAMARLALP